MSRMISISFALSLAIVAGCGGVAPSPGEPGTPAATQITRFSIGAVALPMARADYAGDLNGDGFPDNQYGLVEGMLSNTQDDGQAGIPGMLAGCTLAPTVEVEIPEGADPRNTTATVRWKSGPQGDVTELFGSFEGGRFASPRAHTMKTPIT